MGFRPTFRIEVKSTFIIIGVIMSQMRMAIGRFTWLPLPSSIPRKVWVSEGTSLPSRIPAAMQSATQTDR